MPSKGPGARPAWDHHCLPPDSVDILLASWHERRPDLDFSPVGVVSRLARVRSHIATGLERVFQRYGLSAANFAVLVTLARIGDGGGVSQRWLMDELGLSSGTVSVRIDRLVDEGLVDRQADPQSKRNTLITLTERGRELFERVVPAHLANERRLLSALNAEEQDMLACLLRKLLVEFEGSRPAADAPLALGLVLAPAHVAVTMRESVGLPPVPALLVTSVAEHGPAGRAGVRPGDLLISATGRELRSIAALHAAVNDAAGDQRLQVRLLRGAREHDVAIPLNTAPRPDGTLAATARRATRGEHIV